MSVALVGYQIVAAFGPTLGFFYAMFVRELVDVRSGHWLVPLGYGLIIFIPIYTFLGGPGIVSGVYLEPESPMYLPDLGPGAVVLGAMVYAYMLYALYHLVRARSRTTSSIERNRLTYLIIGVPVVIIGSAMNYIPQFRAYPMDMIANVLNAALTATAIVRYRLLDIPLVLRQGPPFYDHHSHRQHDLLLAGVRYAVQVLHLVAGYQVFMLSLVLAAVAAVAVQTDARRAPGSRRQALLPATSTTLRQMLQRVSQTARRPCSTSSS